MTIEIEPWKHVAGYRLNADGKAIRYEHPETGFEAYIEASLNEFDVDGELDGEMEYIPGIFDEAGNLLTWEICYDVDEGMNRLKRMMEDYS